MSVGSQFQAKRLTNSRLRKSPTSPVVDGPPIFMKTTAVGPFEPLVSWSFGEAAVASDLRDRPEAQGGRSCMHFAFVHLDPKAENPCIRESRESVVGTISASCTARDIEDEEVSSVQWRKSIKGRIQGKTVHLMLRKTYRVSS